MTKLNMHEAKTHLSRYIHRVQEGETIIICRNGEPVAQVSPLSRAMTANAKLFGMARGMGKVPKSFFDPLSRKDLPGFGL